MNLCTDCKSTQQCTTRGHRLPLPQVTSGPCNSVGMWPRADRQTDARDHNTFCVYESREM